MPGSELNWISGAGDAYFIDGFTDLRHVNVADAFFRYAAFLPALERTWKGTDFNFDEDYKRWGTVEILYGAANPDLRKFKAVGGKLIISQGWADQDQVPLDSVDYYELVERTLGGRDATQEFFRLFMIPGMNHCRGGDGAYVIDYLSYLESWVEQGRAPDMMVSAHPQSSKAIDWTSEDWVRFPLNPADIAFTRPVYPYPLRAVYKGTGDPNDSRNFRAVSP